MKKGKNIVFESLKELIEMENLKCCGNCIHQNSRFNSSHHWDNTEYEKLPPCVLQSQLPFNRFCNEWEFDGLSLNDRKQRIK